MFAIERIPLVRHRWARSLLAVIFLAIVATAQVPTREAHPASFRPSLSRVTPNGTVVDLTSETITIKTQNRGTDLENVFPLDKEPVINSLKVINLNDLTEPKWATVFCEPSRIQSEDIVVAWLKVAPKMPEVAASKNEDASKPLPPMAMLDFRIVGGQVIAKGIDILPPFESGARSTRQPGEPPPADTPQK